MLISRFICQTDLKPSSVTNGQNGTITPFSKCYNADRWVRCGMGGGRMETYDGPAWRLISTLCGESATRSLGSFHTYVWGWIRWGVPTVYYKNTLASAAAVCVGMDTLGRSHCLL